MTHDEQTYFFQNKMKEAFKETINYTCSVANSYSRFCIRLGLGVTHDDKIYFSQNKLSNKPLMTAVAGAIFSHATIGQTDRRRTSHYNILKKSNMGQTIFFNCSKSLNSKMKDYDRVLGAHSQSGNEQQKIEFVNCTMDERENKLMRNLRC